MPKRKEVNGHDDKTRKKIAKLEKRLAKYYKDQERKTPEASDDREKAQTLELDPEIEINVELDPEIVDHTGQSIDQCPSVNQASSELDSETGVAQDTNEELDNEFLSALGESASGTKQYGEEIHREIFNTIHKILLEGMQKQNKEKLMETLLIPSNCKLLDAPKLNTELLAVLNNPSRSRDKLMEDRQQEMGLAIGSICQIINSLSKKEYNKFDIIKKLTDVSRVLCNLHYQYTEIRRKLVNPFLDKNLVESLKDNKREEYLYSNLDNSVKSYSAIKRAANVIKPKPVTVGHTKFTPKNFQQPPRRLNPNQVPPGRGSYRGAPHHRYNPRPHFKPQDNRQMGSSTRGRAKYP